MELLHQVLDCAQRHEETRERRYQQQQRAAEPQSQKLLSLCFHLEWLQYSLAKILSVSAIEQIQHKEKKTWNLLDLHIKSSWEVRWVVGLDSVHSNQKKKTSSPSGVHIQQNTQKVYTTRATRDCLLPFTCIYSREWESTASRLLLVGTQGTLKWQSHQEAQVYQLPFPSSSVNYSLLLILCKFFQETNVQVNLQCKHH